MRGGARQRKAARNHAVGVEPWPRCLLHLLPIFASWLIVLAGRPICLVAQRLPPVVRLVRAIRRSRTEGVD